MSIFENAQEVTESSAVPATVPEAARMDVAAAVQAAAVRYDVPERDMFRTMGSQRSVAEAPADRKKQAADKTAGALDALKKFIPTEAIAVFIAGVGIFKSWSAGGTNAQADAAFQWWFWIVLVLAVLFYLLGTFTGLRTRKRGDPPAQPLARNVYFWWKLAAIVVAYAVWAFGISSETAQFVLHLPASDAHVTDVLTLVTVVTSPILTYFDGFFKTFSPAG